MSWREINPTRVSLDVGDTLILPNNPRWFKVVGMEMIGLPVYKLQVELQEIDDSTEEDELSG